MSLLEEVDFKTARLSLTLVHCSDPETQSVFLVSLTQPVLILKNGRSILQKTR